MKSASNSFWCRKGGRGSAAVPGKPGKKEFVMKDDFYLGKYEVTQEEWNKVMKVRDNLKPEAKRLPKGNVLYDLAQQFLSRLNDLDPNPGWHYRLPKNTGMGIRLSRRADE